MMPSTGLLTINLSAIVANWQLLLQEANPMGSGVDCAAVVKADAYGLGVRQVAGALQMAGCQYFFVSTLLEAIELRDCLGSSAIIVVLGGLAHGLSDDWQRYQLLPVLFDEAHVDAWMAYCRRHQQKLPCVLKIDTGMHRLGLMPNTYLQLLSRQDVLENLTPQVLISHLACADIPSHALNQYQLDCFQQMQLCSSKAFPAMRYSLSNSSGMFLGQAFHFDLCRPGAALYGVNPTPSQSNPMRSVVSLTLPVMQCRTVAVGEVVGYGATFVASRETRLATVFGGYADGLLRMLSNQAYGWCQGVRVPLVGRVSMDSMVFDVTEVPDVPVGIEVLNDVQGIDDVAEAAKTIGYEVLTSFGKRYHRAYIHVDGLE